MPVEQMNISLPPRMARFIRGKVKAGEYTNASEVVRDAVRHMQAEEEAGKHRAGLYTFDSEDAAAIGSVRDGIAQLKAGEHLELKTEAALKNYFSDVVSRGKARSATQKGKARSK